LWPFADCADDGDFGCQALFQTATILSHNPVLDLTASLLLLLLLLMLMSGQTVLIFHRAWDDDAVGTAQ